MGSGLEVDSPILDHRRRTGTETPAPHRPLSCWHVHVRATPVLWQPPAMRAEQSGRSASRKVAAARTGRLLPGLRRKESPYQRTRTGLGPQTADTNMHKLDARKRDEEHHGGSPVGRVKVANPRTCNGPAWSTCRLEPFLSFYVPIILCDILSVISKRDSQWLR